LANPTGFCGNGFEMPWGDKIELGSVLKPDQTSLNVLDSIYNEMSPNFSSLYLNVVCDETFKLEKGWSMKFADEKGYMRLYLNFLLKIAELAKTHNWLFC
jgi:hypothetical protein